MRESEFLKRLLASSVVIVLITFLLLFAFHPFFRWILATIVSFLSVIALEEYCDLVKEKNLLLSRPLLLIFAFGIPFSFFLAAHFSFFAFLPFFLLFLAILFFFFFHFCEIENSLFSIAFSSFGLLYIAFPLGILLSILYSPMEVLGVDGRLWVIFLLVTTKVVDIGAYIGGKLWGKRKLAPKISPKKTWEGAIAGFFSALVSFAFFSLFFAGHRWELFLLALCFGILGQLGDLAESLFKRDAKIKDSSTLIGLGGVLDMLDSLLFTLPVLYFFLKGSGVESL